MSGPCGQNAARWIRDVEIVLAASPNPGLCPPPAVTSELFLSLEVSAGALEVGDQSISQLSTRGAPRPGPPAPA